MTITALDLLEMRVRRRKETVRFDVLDTSGSKLGEVNPIRSRIPRVDLNINRAIKRTMPNFAVDAAQAADIDLVADRIQPVWVLQTGDEYPLGVFLFGDGTRRRFTYGQPLDATLVDHGYVLDQGVERSVGFDVGANAVTEAAALAAEVLPSVVQDVTPSTFTIASPVAWPAGTKRSEIINDLLGKAGYYSPWFSNAGELTMRPVPDLSTAAPDFTYESGAKIIAGTITEANDLLSAPNRYLVVDQTQPDSPIYGSYDIPDDAPNSVVRRGFPVLRKIDQKGLASNDEAVSAAMAVALQDASAYEHVAFSATPDPRHDSFNIVQYLGLSYREQSWVLALKPGGPHSHDLRRVYS